MNCKLFKETESANRITNKNSKISLLFTIKFGLWTKRVLIDHTVDLRGISPKDGSLAICSAISLMLGSCAHATTKSTIQVNCHTNSHEIETNSQEIRACINKSSQELNFDNGENRAEYFQFCRNCKMLQQSLVTLSKFEYVKMDANIFSETQPN